MTERQGDRFWSPRPEELAAYADGELDRCGLDKALHQRIEAWLAGHPDSAAEVAAQRRLAALWAKSAPAEPSATTWLDLSARIKKGLQAAPLPRPRHGLRKAFWAALVLVSTAAAVWLAIILASAPAEESPLPESADMEPFPVASADEIEILRVDGNDTSAVVVGKMPVDGPLELAQPGEVTLVSVQPDVTDDMMPKVHMNDETPPMLWAPLPTEAQK